MFIDFKTVVMYSTNNGILTVLNINFKDWTLELNNVRKFYLGYFCFILFFKLKYLLNVLEMNYCI